MLELELVFVVIEMAMRICNKTIVAKRPLLVTTEPHDISGNIRDRYWFL